MEFIRMEAYEEILKELQQYDASFMRRISDRVDDLDNYARKLCRYAQNYRAVIDGHPAGFFSFYDNDTAGKKAYLTLIAVAPEYRGKNWGSRMLQFILEECRKKQMRKLCLEVDKMNGWACGFYHKNGFRVVEDASEHSYYMEKEI